MSSQGLCLTSPSKPLDQKRGAWFRRTLQSMRWVRCSWMFTMFAHHVWVGVSLNGADRLLLRPWTGVLRNSLMDISNSLKSHTMICASCANTCIKQFRCPPNWTSTLCSSVYWEKNSDRMSLKQCRSLASTLKFHYVGSTTSEEFMHGKRLMSILNITYLKLYCIICIIIIHSVFYIKKHGNSEHLSLFFSPMSPCCRFAHQAFNSVMFLQSWPCTCWLRKATTCQFLRTAKTLL